MIKHSKEVHSAVYVYDNKWRAIGESIQLGLKTRTIVNGMLAVRTFWKLC